MTRTVKSFCRNCAAQCGVELEIENNKIVSLRGDRANPISKGYFCIKAEASRIRQNGASRLSSSLKLSDGIHHPIATAEAIREIGARLDDLVARHGPGAVGLYYGTAVYGSTLAIPFAKAWAQCLGTPQVYSSQTIDQSPKVIRALRMGHFKAGKHPFQSSDVWLLSGANPLVSHLGGWGSMTAYAPGKDIKEAKKRGLKLIVIDPRLTETARLADLHIQLKPGQDVAVNAALIHIILGNGWQDRDFCDRYAINLDVLRAAVSRYTPEYAATEADVRADDLRRAAEMFATAARGSTASGTGSNMAPYGNLAEHLLECLNVICGRYRRAGDPIVNPNALILPRISEGVYPPYPVWDHSPKMASHPEVGWSLPNEYPANLLADEILHEGENRLRALICIGGNPVQGFPDQNSVTTALRKLELLVSLDVVKNETGALSHYVVNAKTPYERADIALLTDGNSPFPAAQYSEPIVVAPDAVEEWEFFYDLSRHMGIELTWEFANFGSPASGKRHKLDMVNKPTTQELLECVCQHPDLPFSVLKAAPGAHLPVLRPQYVQPAAEEDAGKLDLMPEEVLDELEESYATHQGQALGAGEMLLHVRRILELMNSNYSDITLENRRYPHNPLRMNPLDMAERGMREGDPVRITSAHGELLTRLSADSTQRRGAVSMSHSWASESPVGATVGVLIDKNGPRDSHNYTPRMTAIPVRIARC